MQAPPNRPPTVLSPSDLTRYRRDGFVRVKRAFSPDLAQVLQDEVWAEMKEEHGIDRSDRGTWRTPPRSPRRAKVHAANARLEQEPFGGVISDLLGHDEWERPRTWGGFLVTFPQDEPRTWDVPADGWH